VKAAPGRGLDPLLRSRCTGRQNHCSKPASANRAGIPAELRYTAAVIVLGVDCGTEVTGYGVVELVPGGDLACIAAAAIRLSPREPMAARLACVHRTLCDAIARYRPTMVAIEDVFYAVNAKSALKLGQVRGVAMLAAASSGLPVAEYAPLSIKSAVVGYGKADKQQVQHMVARLLRLDELPEPADVADALAIAICHLHTSATLDRQAAAVGASSLARHSE
jgi:crossover junction endodeoxyribonuclease RuvC